MKFCKFGNVVLPVAKSKITIIMRHFTLLITCLCLFAGQTFGQGDEHPEHPEEEKQQEQSLTIEEFADAAKKYIKQKSKENGGYFMVKDEKQDKTLKLKLEKVHRKRLSHLGNNVYFVCADFKGQDGKTYDIDIFMKGTSKENLEVTRDPMVHKVNGEERFTWHKEDGVWKRKQKGKKQHEHPKEHPEGSEHPEHPEN